MKPIYAEQLVVAIKKSNKMDWYILDKDYCFLDYKKLEDAYRRKGYDVFIDDAPRFGLKIVNEFTCDSFLECIIDYKISTESLKQMLNEESCYNDKLAYNPSMYIDFDDKKLYSNYSEPESFEAFVPDGWEGEYRDFSDLVPENKRFWLDKDGNSLIGG